MIVTQEHGRAIERLLYGQGLNLESLEQQRRFVAADAAATLARLIRGGQLSEERIAREVELLFGRLANDQPVRIFGEMVMLLWSEGRRSYAARLEELCDGVCADRTCHILCGYPLDIFCGDAHSSSFAGVCARHTHVIPSESFSALPDVSEQLKCVALLQQKARSLEAEVIRRNQLLETMRLSAERERTFLREVLASFTDGRVQLCDRAADLPPVLSRESPPMALQADTLWLMRRHIEEVALKLGFPPERWADLVMAAGEAAMNAVVHAADGRAVISSNGETTLQVRITDHGRGIAREYLHQATLQRGFTTKGTMGHGFWIMFKTADRIWLFTGPQGTTVVLEQDSATPPPPWLHSL